MHNWIFEERIRIEIGLIVIYCYPNKRPNYAAKTSPKPHLRAQKPFHVVMLANNTQGKIWRPLAQKLSLL